MFCKAMVFTPLIPKLTASFSMLMVFPYLPFPDFRLRSDPLPDPEHPHPMPPAAVLPGGSPVGASPGPEWTSPGPGGSPCCCWRVRCH